MGGPHSSQITEMAFSGEAARLQDMTLTTRALRQEVAYWAPEFGGRKWVLRVRDWLSQNGVFGFG